MQKINFILQFILRFFLIFLLLFIWIRFFTRSLLLSFIISTLFALTIEIILRLITARFDKSKSLKLKEEEDCENMFLSLSTSKNSLQFFFELAKKKHRAIKKKKYVLIEHEDYKVVLYPHLSFAAISPDDVAKIVNLTKSENPKKIVICCGEVLKESLSFTRNFDTEIILLDKYDSYKKLYKDYGFFPNITLTYKKDKKTTMKELLSISFNRSRTKNYMFSAVVILFSSLFVRLNIYYTIVSSLLVIFAIISFFNPFYKPAQKFEL